MTPHTGAWTDDDLDTALAALAQDADVTDVDHRLERLRTRVFDLDSATTRKAGDRFLPGRRRRRTGLLVGGVTAALLTAGGVAAATGHLDGLAARAFRDTSNGTAQVDQMVRRVATGMPDGGPGTIELWGAPSTDGDPDRLCLSVVTDTPEERPAGKAWSPQALCNPITDGTWSSGSYWNRPGSSRLFHQWAGYITNARFVELTDIHRQKVVVPARDGYYIAFLPVVGDRDDQVGLAVTYTDGKRRVLLEPRPAVRGG